MGPVLEADGAAVPGVGGVTRAAFAFVFVTVLLDMLALGIIVPVLPALVVSLSGGDTARGATIYGLFGTTFAAMQFVFSPVLGSLSDRFGRRRVILLSNFGLGLDYVLMAMAPSLWWLFAGRVVSGITSSSLPTAMAYIADVTDPGERAGKFGLLGVAFGVGFIVGPAVGGLLGGISLRAPFWGAAALSLANATYGFFILPESLTLERRMPFHWKRANVVGAFRMLRSRPTLFALGAASFLSMLAHDSLPTTFVLYTSYRYAWGEKMVGLVLAMVGALMIVVQGGLVRRIVGWLGERKAMAAGFFAGAIGMSAYAVAPTGTVFLLGLPFTALYGLATPALQSLMTGSVGADEQGQLQGAIGSLNGVANMIAPVLFTIIFAEAVGRFRGWNIVGAPFFAAGTLLVGALAVGWRVTARASQLPADV